jgi:glycosyltransferase involved in cell wall biosynthesis
MVVATRNRAHALRIVAPSFYAQEAVDEIVFVDDAGEDDTPALLAEFAARWPHVRTVHLRNPERRGLPAARNRGAAAARNPYLLFCDDDEHLQPGYAATCLDKLLRHGAAAVGGRRIYMQDGETPEEAARRFGDGFSGRPPIRRLLCELVGGARFQGDLDVPFAFPNMVAPTELVRRHGFDEFYGTGSCYREETDFFLNLFLAGHRIVMTNDVRSLHLSVAQTRLGGARVDRAARVYWSVRFTDHLYRKYWRAYARRVGLPVPRQVALACFAVFSAYREYLRPYIYRPMMRYLRWRHARRMRGAAPAAG